MPVELLPQATSTTAVLVERIRFVRATRRAGVAALTEHPAQGLRELRRVRVAQRHDVHVAGHGGRRVEFLRQLLRRREPAAVRRANQQRVGARIRGDRHLQRRVGAADRAGVEHLGQLRGDVDRVRVLQLHHRYRLARRRIDTRDDLRDTPHVVGVIGHDNRVVGRVGRHGIVRRDQRTQHRQQVIGRFVLQHEHLRDHLIASRHRRIADVGRHALQLGIGLGHDLQHAVVLHQREALHPQSGLQGLERLIFRHCIFRHEVQLTLHAWVDDDRFAGCRADRLGHLVDIGVHEVECHLCLCCLRGDQSSHQQRRCDATQCHTISSHGIWDRCRRPQPPTVMQCEHLSRPPPCRSASRPHRRSTPWMPDIQCPKKMNSNSFSCRICHKTNGSVRLL